MSSPKMNSPSSAKETNTKDNSTLFEKIASGKIPSTKVFEDDFVYAFKDISPAAPVHVLLVPKRLDGLDRIHNATSKHEQILGKLMVAVPSVAKAAGISEYRVVINNGPKAGQSVFHLHLHIIGGEGCAFKWPPV